MLMNNLDPEVAERPDELIVYGGTGRAARNWACFDAIVRSLRSLGNEETLLVQSGKPVGVFASHPDHLSTGEATLRAVYPDARNPHAFPALLSDEGLEPHTVTRVWIGGGGAMGPTMVVDMTAAFDKKLQALKSHKSQVGDGERLEPMLREWGGMIAKSAGLPKGRLAEAYRVIVTG